MSKEKTIYPPVKILVDSDNHNHCSDECPMMHQTWGMLPIISCRLFGDLNVYRKFDKTNRIVESQIVYRNAGCVNCLSKGEIKDES